MSQMNFTTRRPSGKPSFPMVLLAGVEGSGKTWAAVETTTMPDVGRAFFIEIGESMADEYGAIPGANFEIIEHDGTVGQIRAAIDWASSQPVDEGKYNLLIMDSMTEVWTLLSDNAQDTANRRAKAKRRQVSEDGAQITMDLWNRATDAWNGLITQCRRFPGPVLLTARLEMVTLMDSNGQPTKDKDWKVRAQKNLSYNVQVVMQAREPRRWTMTKIATTAEALQLPPGKERTFNDFSMAQLLTTMGIGPEAAATTFVAPHTNGELSDEQQLPQGNQRPPKPPTSAGPTPEDRADDLKKWRTNLLAFEKEGNLDKVAQGLAWATKRGDKEKSQDARKVHDRMVNKVAQAKPVAA